MVRNATILFGVLACVVAFSLPALADTGPTVSSREKENEARELAQQMLIGSKVVVRVYNDWQADPQAYKLLSVPLTGLSVHHSAVKKAYPDINKSDISMIVARDQLDKTGQFKLTLANSG